MAPASMPRPRSAVPNWALYAGAAALAAGAWFFLQRRRAANTASSTDTTGGAVMPSTVAGTSSDLAAYLANMGTPDTTTTPGANYAPPYGLRVQGQGYSPAPGEYTAPAATGETFTEIANAKARNQLVAAGQTVYYQPAPGIFVPWSTALRKTGTRTYLKIGA